MNHLGTHPRDGAVLSPEFNPVRRRLWRILLAGAGLLALGLGILGIFLPLLPTTPFLLLAAACFMRSSTRLYNWLMRHPWFGSTIREYREHRAISLQVKCSSLVLLWLTIGYTVLFVAQTGWLRLLLGTVAVGVTTHLLSLKTIRREAREPVDEGLGVRGWMQ